MSDKRPTHRELMYDPQHSTRRFKKIMGSTTSRGAVEFAWNMGLESVDGDTRKRWQTNPYRKGGRRWQAYEDGRSAVLRDMDEERTYRRWNPG
jgi:hypothetical protein